MQKDAMLFNVRVFFHFLNILGFLIINVLLNWTKFPKLRKYSEIGKHFLRWGSVYKLEKIIKLWLWVGMLGNLKVFQKIVKCLGMEKISKLRLNSLTWKKNVIIMRLFIPRLFYSKSSINTASCIVDNVCRVTRHMYRVEGFYTTPKKFLHHSKKNQECLNLLKLIHLREK